MKTYHATAYWEEDLWTITIVGVGVTQGSTAQEARDMAQDYVALMTGSTLDEVHVDIKFLDDEK